MSGRIITETPVGLLEIISDGKAITAIRRCYASEGIISEDRITCEAKRQLEEYFAGKRKMFDLPIVPQGTDFRQSVWKALTEIPYGETRSYGEIAAAVGKPSAQRAAGSAIGDNPILILIPCHRVIRADGGIGGFSAGIDMKKFLMKLEGHLY